MTKYNKEAVNREIAKDKRIKRKEAKLIHALLKGPPYGAHGEPERTTHHTHTKIEAGRYVDYTPEEEGA